MSTTISPDFMLLLDLMYHPTFLRGDLGYSLVQNFYCCVMEFCGTCIHSSLRSQRPARTEKRAAQIARSAT